MRDPASVEQAIARWRPIVRGLGLANVSELLAILDVAEAAERLRAERDALFALARNVPDILQSPRGWDRGVTDRYEVDDEDMHGLRETWAALPDALRAAIEAGEPEGGDDDD